ncbi:jg22315 [Pararge aegeria aegeria]|uniref:Jg22315 protein n=1 Tax=Pararge aegeria aegeria TaxID=348720 RepID=A0A8S4QS34_9NEOP|nr:jg22315 [Pararge aegeria aegeria]
MSDVPCPGSSTNDNQEAFSQEAISAISDNKYKPRSLSRGTSSSEPSLKIVGEEVDDGMTTAVTSSPEYTKPPSVMRPKRIRKPIIRFSP